MKFIQPKLPYAPDALSPVISENTIEYHYGKHEKAYFDTLNSLIEGTEYADMSLEEIICKSDGKLFNNGVESHFLLFSVLAVSQQRAARRTPRSNRP